MKIFSLCWILKGFFFLRKVSSALRSFFCLNKNGDLGFEIKSEDLFSDFRTNFARLFHSYFAEKNVLFIIRFIDPREKVSSFNRFWFEADKMLLQSWKGCGWRLKSTRAAMRMHLNGNWGWNLMWFTFEV